MLKMKQNLTSDLQRCTRLIQRRCPYYYYCSCEYLITCSAWCMSASIHIICTLSDDSGNYFFWSFFSLVHLIILCRQCSSFAACKLICSSLFLLLVRYICWDIMASVLPRNTISRHVWRNNYILLYLWSLIFVFLVAIKHPYEFAIFTVT